MKRFIAIILIPLFIYNSAGYYIVFKILHNSVEQEITENYKKNIKEKDLIKITFTDTDNIRWTKTGKEFAYDGYMYDVVKSVTKDGNLTFYCIQDFEDSELYDNLSQIVSSQLLNSKDQKKKADKMLQLILKLLFIDISDFNIYQVPSVNHFIIKKFSILIPDLKPKTPPPISAFL